MQRSDTADLISKVEEIKKQEELPEILVVLLANNITVKAEWIDACVKMMQEDMTISAVVPVYEDNDHHPLRGKRVDENGRMQKKLERVGVGLDNKEIKATAFTSYQDDFRGNVDNIVTTLNSHRSLVMFIVKKNVSVLTKLYNWLTEQNKDMLDDLIHEPMLLIDDEADNVGTVPECLLPQRHGVVLVAVFLVKQFQRIEDTLIVSALNGRLRDPLPELCLKGTFFPDDAKFVERLVLTYGILPIVGAAGIFGCVLYSYRVALAHGILQNLLLQSAHLNAQVVGGAHGALYAE